MVNGLGTDSVIKTAYGIDCFLYIVLNCPGSGRYNNGRVSGCSELGF